MDEGGRVVRRGPLDDGAGREAPARKGRRARRWAVVVVRSPLGRCPAVARVVQRRGLARGQAPVGPWWYHDELGSRCARDSGG